VLEALPRETYLEARLETGRTHQIRAHFAAIGNPLAGDETYGGHRRYGLGRQFLHSHLLAFRHPETGKRLEFRSDLPSDLQHALELARDAWAQQSPTSNDLLTTNVLSTLRTAGPTN
jgi:23S rRNA pseudouridine1911/1915/1917 synthase